MQIFQQHADELSLLICVHNDNVATWSVKLTEDLDGETFSSIVFNDETVKLVTADGREYPVGEEVYQNYFDAVSCGEHHIVEFDSFGSWRREYAVSTPVVQEVRSFGV